MDEVNTDNLKPSFARDDGYVVTRKGLESKETVKTREWIRQQIETFADTRSREGILADVLGLMLVNFSQLTMAMAQAKTVSDIKAAAQPLADIFTVIDAEVKAGTLKLPYRVKPRGAQGVLADMSHLSNDITVVLLTEQKQNQ
ncbi:hypothetical protein SK355_07415 [Candidatus Fukatsuia symbiotica]|uniref:Uncharacterized protein n=1 Tax=Candidatus Fukatsuia symbiotica TaxID=1878942 RepID=A0A2U8I6F4_9GAMM|nr:hypothetical protein [Candidatus Fukatsuia symbiotica]AWK14756.1 hypothetical protein CCS41_10165 [Candidatus Fukatsuia symbiotica]MEA9445089.1 hypothetical protein [Candidatus Fukatsuia symbiotica]